MASVSDSPTRPLPFEVEEVPPEGVRRFQELGFVDYSRLVMTKPKIAMFRPGYAELASRFYNFQFRPQDIVILTYPKAGTTWTGELIWAMRNIDKLHLAKESTTTSRLFFIDMDVLRRTFPNKEDPKLKQFQEVCPEGRVEDGIVLQLAAAEKGPRIIKTHLRFDLLNPDLLDTCKVVYTVRNPKDTCVSYYHHSVNSTMSTFNGDFENFAEAFLDKGITFGPYWEHLREACKHKGHKNLHFMFYENMKKDILGELRKLATFLEMDLDDDQLKKVAEHASFKQMKDRHQGQHPIRDFFRKGVVGDWKNHATEELNEKMDKWIRENSRGIDLEIKYS